MIKVVITLTLLKTYLGTAAAPRAPAQSFLARRDYNQLSNGGIALADTNGDHIPDTISVGGSDVSVMFGNGNGTLREGPISTVDMSFGLFPPIATDLNRDGKVDIITSAGHHVGSGGGLGVCFGNGDGT